MRSPLLVRISVENFEEIADIRIVEQVACSDISQERYRAIKTRGLPISAHSLSANVQNGEY
jgi:hypothetical protein